MLRRLVASKSRDGYNKGDVLLWRDWDVWATECEKDDSVAQRLRALPDDFVVIELDKHNAMVDAHSIGELRRLVAAQTVNDASLPSGYRPLLPKDLGM